jgi:hypothetical protein
MPLSKLPSPKRLNGTSVKVAKPPTSMPLLKRRPISIVPPQSPAR